MCNLEYRSLNLITYFSWIVAIATLITIYNIVGVLLISVSITGIVAWMLQVFAAYAALALGVISGVYHAVNWFLNGIHKTFFNEIVEE
jgi:uncharacterized phage infection (PIP) family protein YhgE